MHYTESFLGKLCTIESHIFSYYRRADVRCLSRVTDLILWNIRKTRNSSIFQNVKEGLHFTSSWALSSVGLSDCLWMQCCSIQRCFLISSITYNFYGNSTKPIHILPNQRNNILILLLYWLLRILFKYK